MSIRRGLTSTSCPHGTTPHERRKRHATYSFGHAHCRAGRHRRHAPLRTVRGRRGLRSRPDPHRGPLVRLHPLRERPGARRPLPSGTRPRTRPPRARRHGRRPRLGRHGSRAARRTGRGGARRSRSRLPRGLTVHGRLRPGCGGAARRQARHHALGPHAGTGPAPPSGHRRSGRPLRRQRRRPHLGGQGRRHGPVPAPGPPRPRLGHRQQDRPPSGHPAAPRRRSGPVFGPSATWDRIGRCERLDPVPRRVNGRQPDGRTRSTDQPRCTPGLPWPFVSRAGGARRASGIRPWSRRCRPSRRGGRRPSSGRCRPGPDRSRSGRSCRPSSRRLCRSCWSCRSSRSGDPPSSTRRC